MIKTIIWDWNGTLLDDLENNIEIVNIILSRRNLRLLTKDSYRRIFSFPVFDFYKKIGLDMEKETLAEISEEYMKLYSERFKYNRLNEGVEQILDDLKNRNIKSYILSATNHTDLKNQVDEMKITSCFKKIVGNTNIEGKSKIEKANELVKNEFIDPAETLVIGDTLHDLEVAESVKSNCVLLSSGHQQLQSNGKYNLIDKLSDIYRYL
ncbi:MAG: HAD family hydrolase [Bacteroidales bacterium]|jgi:phosphoglycolate phosphatase|nr:HAD family hydrolase [Bacteroidales bacterium]